MANVSDAMPYADGFRSHLRKILESPAFRSSHRSQEFLRHVVEVALAGEFDRLKERILGIEIFRRDAEYDTGEDAIVRVSANDVRKRLVQYYAEAPNDEFRINLLSGSYIPEFRYLGVETPAAAAEAEPLHESSLGALPDAAEQVAAGENSLPEPAQTSAVSTEPTASRRIAARIGLLCVVLAAFVIGWFANGFFLRRNSVLTGAPDSRSRFSFYHELLGPMLSDTQMPTDVVVSNPKIFLYRGSNQTNTDEDAGALKIPLPPSLARELQEGANDTQADFPYHRLVLDTQDYTGLGEAKTLFGLGLLLASVNRPARLTEARFLNWDAARSEHLIVLGAPHMSEWTQATLANANFTMDHDAVRNNHPQPGEQALYVRTGQGVALVDYGLIWMSQSPSGARILVLAGITSAGTAGVGSFFADPDAMRPVYEQLRHAAHGHIPANWQVLLRIEARDNVPVKVSPVAVRVGP